MRLPVWPGHLSSIHPFIVHREVPDPGNRVQPTRDPDGLMPLAKEQEFGLWWEKEPRDKLHLCDERRLKLGENCINYLKYLYNIGGPIYHSDNDINWRDVLRGEVPNRHCFISNFYLQFSQKYVYRPFRSYCL